ncbi:hypothetical protein BATDEDRAFT_21249 [Batrachochytrium dendrobatidis JAM81]|uniref:Nudix hydrolase domain-containing protein n=1 Tax=Batrachochytrium dendrobatidis (strain JAM81 / FGSC 10211) TaxID=684364 RepID=F4NRY3_BATDJ|nr:uncharacterized protein BATDEDRAFT_21249 [Batrachochytrium dendrobatidis JAM81]EGF83781.1 hypothetical protein BATDEDRAFT_21249 [Batrachochytrium dendrobatidis JAM81]|eukprot:XP_006675234.1 hypothetical protein BATDEDRAFT_21249 [Batrachochytrium dendrobatidis JAM81]
MLDKQMNELAQSRKQQPIVSEQQTYKRFLTVWSRQVQSPDGRVIDWDVAGHGTQAPAFATVFPYNSKKKTVRLLVEYAQGPNVMAYTFAAGGFDAKKHKNSIQDTAESELSEEAKLRGGKWIRLIPPDHDGIPELKWSRNKFVPFLVIDPEDDIAPLSCDTEEYIEPLDISLDTLHTYILQGLVMLPSVQTALMATDWLRKNEYI